MFVYYWIVEAFVSHHYGTLQTEPSFPLLVTIGQGRVIANCEPFLTTPTLMCYTGFLETLLMEEGPMATANNKGDGRGHHAQKEGD